LAIARHKALSALRRRSDEHLDDDVLAMIEDHADDPETLVEKEDRRAIVQNCLTAVFGLGRNDGFASNPEVTASQYRRPLHLNQQTLDGVLSLGMCGR
jgi:hypothetical protein